MNNRGRVRSAALVKEKVLPFLIGTVNVPSVSVVSTADFAGNARPSPILIYFLSFRQQDHHAGSHSSQVLVFIVRGRAGPVTAYVKVIRPGDRYPSIGGYPGCHLSVRNIGIQTRKPLSSDRRTLLGSTMQGMKKKCAEGSR